MSANLWALCGVRMWWGQAAHWGGPEMTGKPRYIFNLLLQHFCINITSLNLGGMVYRHVTERHRGKDGVCWGKTDLWAASHSLALLMLFAYCHDVTLKENPGFHWFSSSDAIYECPVSKHCQQHIVVGSESVLGNGCSVLCSGYPSAESFPSDGAVATLVVSPIEHCNPRGQKSGNISAYEWPRHQ